MSKRPESTVGIVETTYFSFIDGLRGVAILLVIAIHAAQPFVFRRPEISALVSSGARGVQLFFILSAFTLFSSSLQRFGLERNPTRNFYLRRAFRILPLWWIALLTYYVWPPPGWSNLPPSPIDFVLHATFLFGFSPWHVNSLLPGSWSLFCEETFYLLLPIIANRIRAVNDAARLAMVLTIVSACWYIIAARTIGRTFGDFVFFFPLSQWPFFGIGIVLFFVAKSAGARALTGPIASLADAAVVVCIWSAFAGSPPGPVQYPSLVALFGLCFVASQEDSVIRRIVDTRLLRMFGRSCYSIYLFHILLISRLDPLRERLFVVLHISTMSAEVRFLAWYCTVSTVCLGFGMLSFNVFEKRFVRLGREYVRQLEIRAVTARPVDTIAKR